MTTVLGRTQGTEADLWQARTMTSTCLVIPPPTIDAGADVLAKAAAALRGGQTDEAGRLVRSIDESAYRAFWNAGATVWTERHDKTAHVAGDAPKHPRGIAAATRKAVADRDGWRCRYCGIRLLSKEFVLGLNDKLGEVFPWGPSEASRHSAGVVLLYTPDHVEPHWNGGTNEPENLVAACGTCNYMKWSCTLNELGLSDPRLRDPVVDGWNGLVGALA